MQDMRRLAYFFVELSKSFKEVLAPSFSTVGTVQLTESIASPRIVVGLCAEANAELVGLLGSANFE